MKRLPYIVILLLVLCALSCTRTSRHPQLVAVDSLLLERPDSALQVLSSPKGEVGGMGRQELLPYRGRLGGGFNLSSKANRMYYYLLLADACNKCYDTLPSDSILREVADFYDSHGTPNEQMRAHYLLGCAYRDMGEAPQALDCYHDAIDCADTTASDCNYRLLMSVYGQMASIFDKQNLPQDELDALRMSGHFALQLKDTLLYIRSMELEIKPYNLLGDTAKVLEIIEKTQKLYRKLGYSFMAIRENGLLISICMQKGDLVKTKELMQEFEEGSQLFDNNGNIGEGRQIYYDFKGRYYVMTHQLDSAEYYMRKLLLYGYNSQAYRGLMSIYQLRGQTDSIVSFMYQYEKAIDINNNRLRTEVVSQMSAMYNYHRYQQMAEHERATAYRFKWMLGLISLVFIVIAIIIIRYIRISKRRKQRELEQLHLSYIQAQADYGRKEEELKLLINDSEQLKIMREREIEQLKGVIMGYKEKMMATNNHPSDTEDKLLEDTIKSFHLNASGSRKASVPTKRDWKDLERLFKKNKPAEQLVVCAEGLLAANEQRTCILLLLGFTNSEIANLLDFTPQRVTNIKSRINKKLFHDDSASTLQANFKYLSSKV